MKVSIVMPVLNEAEHISARLLALNALLHRRQTISYEIIVVDGSSDDNSAALARAHATRVISAPRGRALQMNAGAAAACGEVLLFLHADTILPEHALEYVESGVNAWGWFNVRLSGQNFMFRIIERMMSLRSRLTQVATGDQAIFVARKLFDRVGGFPELSLMEDVALSKILRKQTKPLPIQQSVITSSRRWQQYGIIKTVFLMWWLRLLYFLGVSPSHLARLYS